VVLCTRFRGNMDVWDPAFLDALAASGFQVITFDYSGLGLSGGERSFGLPSMAKDAHDLIEALELKDTVICGWSLGGMVAQVVLVTYPQRLSHAVLIGTVPPGPNVKPAEQLFYDTASIPDYGFEEEVILFFEPRSAGSRPAHAQSQRTCARGLGRGQSGRQATQPVVPGRRRARRPQAHQRAHPACRWGPRHHLSGRELVRAEPAIADAAIAHLSDDRPWSAP
jgi:pimeloyl-ACP methyl ester carboxylesterase